MKARIFSIISFILLTLLAVSGCGDSNSPTSGTSSSSGSRMTIAVVAHSDFIPDRTQAQKGTIIGLPDELANRIIEHLTNSKRFIPVERTALRKLILEQRFGQDLSKTYLDRTLDKAIGAMESVEGGAIRVTPDKASPAGRIPEGEGAVGTTGALADYNDVLKDFQDLGTAVGADYLILGNLEKLARASQETPVPYSTEGRTVRENTIDARLQLRVIKVKSGTVAGAASIRTKVAESVFEGKKSDTDEYSFFDHLGRLAASKVLDVTFPARIVSMEPLVLSRGINDGAKEGDIYIIEREGKDIKDDSGAVIARLKSEVGKVEIVTPQDTVSVVKPVEGSGFAKDDLASLDVRASETSAKIATSAKVPLTGRAAEQISASKLPRLAVGFVKSGSTAATGEDASKHTPIFTDSIISRLTQTKRFQMIDRQEVDQLLTEQVAQSLAEGRDMPSAMGTLKGADYLVYGSLASFSVEDKVVQLPGSAHTFPTKIGHVEGNMRIVDARSGDILESRKISVEERIEPAAEGSRSVTALADAYAEQVVLILMNAVYPIKAAAVGQDGMVYINRGEDGGLSEGEVLDAFRPGKTITDPDTGVQLGAEETVIGQVIVKEVEDARSKGVPADGAKVAIGDILKRTAANRDKRASAAVQKSAAVRTGGTLSGSVQKEGQPAAGGKYTLAVGLLKVNPAARANELAAGHVKRMSDDLILKLTNTNRFVVMDRQEVDQILGEKAFEAIASGGDIQDRLGELVGADYLIHGEIANFYTQTDREKVPYLDEEQVSVTAVAEGMFRIVDVHTGAVIGADKVRYQEKIGHAEDMTQVMSNLMDEFTTNSVGAIVARLFPIKVLGLASDGIVYLNRGADAGLQMGAAFDVMRPGQELKDSDTGLSFGQAETKVAAVEIVAVEANRARARLISGEAAQAGDILRKSQIVSKKEERKVNRPDF